MVLEKYLVSVALMIHLSSIPALSTIAQTNNQALMTSVSLVSGLFSLIFCCLPVIIIILIFGALIYLRNLFANQNNGPILESLDESQIKYFPELTHKPVALAENGYYYILEKAGSGKYRFSRPLHRDVAYRKIWNIEWVISTSPFISITHPVSFFEKEYPGWNFSEMVVHHIDKNKTNNNPENLAIIMPQEHDDLINHDNIVYGDRSSGIKELRRVGIKILNMPKEDK